MNRWKSLAALLAVVIVLGIVGLFALDVGGSAPDPVDFDDTITVGLTLEDELALDADEETPVDLPRAQVFYSQYPYVVGYYGVEQFVADRNQPGHEQRFGFPISMYVTDYGDGDVTLTDEGYPIVEGSISWAPADEAVYVVGSEARTPAGETAIPFTDREAADTFTADHGGTVYTWEEVLETEFDIDDAETVRERLADHHRHADELVENRSTLLERPVEVVVGDDVETIQDGIDVAPRNSTVLVPAGAYDETIEINESITVRGADGAHLRGNGSGTVVTVTAEGAAVTGLEISGVGDVVPGAGSAHAHDHDHSTNDVEAGTDNEDEDEDEDDTAWDDPVEEYYATGDAGILVERVESVLITDVAIDTQASGIMLLDSPDSVVRNVSVVGNQNYREAHMGIVALRSPGVVEQSRFEAGLDGVYTHRADGIVIRDNVMTGNRMGVHLMHTSGATIADNTITDQVSTGIYVMTGPERNSLVGNHVSQTPTGINVGGSDSYVGNNALTENDLGLRIDTTSSIVEANLVAGNDDGVEARALLPTNRVTRNDFVDNDRHVGRTTGPLRVWTDEAVGNYWDGAVGTTDGTVLERPYSPTDPVDSRLHRVDGAETLAQAPAVDALAGFEGSVPGLRTDEVVDVTPLCEPVDADRVRAEGYSASAPVCYTNDGMEGIDERDDDDSDDKRNQNRGMIAGTSTEDQ